MSEESLDFWLVIIRGVVGRCPNCGEGKLFASYLKPVNNCAYCDAALGDIRADDGPTWLTIILVGHILAPFLLSIVPNSTIPDWQAMILWPTLALVLALMILPRAKGVFIGALWRLR